MLRFFVWSIWLLRRGMIYLNCRGHGETQFLVHFLLSKNKFWSNALLIKQVFYLSGSGDYFLKIKSIIIELTNLSMCNNNYERKFGTFIRMRKILCKLELMRTKSNSNDFQNQTDILYYRCTERFEIIYTRTIALIY